MGQGRRGRDIGFIAFGSRGTTRQVTACLIVRRVRDANPDHVTVDAQGERSASGPTTGVFTDSPLPMLPAEADHHRYAIIEQVIANLKTPPSRTCRRAASPRTPRGSSSPRCIQPHRAAGALASIYHAKATTATVRRQLIAVAARVTRSARRSVLRLPAACPRLHSLATAVHRRLWR